MRASLNDSCWEAVDDDDFDLIAHDEGIGGMPAVRLRVWESGERARECGALRPPPEPAPSPCRGLVDASASGCRPESHLIAPGTMDAIVV